MLAALRDDRGSAPAEFVMVGTLLTFLTLAVLQLALALFVRNTVLDAAAEGARQAALADGSLASGAQRTAALITATLGPDYARQITVGRTTWHGHSVAVVTVSTPLPVAGLFGPPAALTVSGHAAIERLP